MRAICPWQVWQNRHCAKYAAIGNQHWQIVVGVIQTLIIRAMLPETKGPISGLRGARAVAMPLTYFWYWTIAPILPLVPDSEARESSTSCCMRSVRLKADCPEHNAGVCIVPDLIAESVDDLLPHQASRTVKAYELCTWSVVFAADAAHRIPLTAR